MNVRKLKIEIVCENAAFEDNGAASEIARILRVFADQCDNDMLHSQKYLFDSNGNTVGEATFKTYRVRE